MKVAIIGSGNIGRALALLSVKAGHEVSVGGKFPLSDKSLALAKELGEEKIMPVNEACSISDLIVIATPAHIIVSLIPELGDLKNKIIVDATNAVRFKPEPFHTAFEAIQKLTTCEAVIKCFNTTGFENLIQPQSPHGNVDLFAAGSHIKAKETVTNYALSLGFEHCYDFGGDDKVTLLEQFALSWINLAIMQGLGRNIIFKVHKR